MKLDFCVACGSKDDLDHHHIVPRSLGGTNKKENLITFCRKCHGLAHDTVFRPISELVTKGIAAAKRKGTRIGKKRKVVTYDSLLSNLDKIPAYLLPAMVLHSYGYSFPEIVKVKWSQIDLIPLKDKYRKLIIRPDKALDDDLIVMSANRHLETLSVNSLTVNIHRYTKRFYLETTENPPVTRSDLINIVNLLYDFEE